MRREPGSFYRLTLGLFAETYPSRPTGWRHERARAAVRAVQAIGTPAVVPDGEPGQELS